VSRWLAIVALLLCANVAQARDRWQVAQFRKTHPCPATGRTTGACPGWVVDHGTPLCLGGADRPFNMHWQPRAESLQKDAMERELCRRACK